MNENIFGGNDILKYPYKQLSKFAIEFYTPSAVTFKNKNFYYEMPLNVQDSIYWNGLLKKNEEVQLPISMSGTKIHIIIVCNQKFLEYTNIKLSKDGNIIEESSFLNIYINTKMINDIDSLTIKNLSPSNSMYDILLFSVSDVNLPWFFHDFTINNTKSRISKIEIIENNIYKNLGNKRVAIWCK